MLKKGLLHEFHHETENTRKLLQAIPNSALNWKPNEINWSIAELASHIAGIYDWYTPVLNVNKFELDKYQYDKGDISKIENIIAKFEKNAAIALNELENFDESKATEMWCMTANEHEVIPPMPRIAVLRSILCNHLYHHRGEMIAYLRMSGNKVPGLYGPTADDK